MIDELEAYERDVHACGYHKSLIVPENGFVPEVSHCPVCAAGSAYARVLHAEDEEARKERSDAAPPGRPLPSDGRQVYMRLLTPAENAAAREAAAARSGHTPT